MNKKEKTKIVSQTLSQYFPDPKPSLNFSSPFTLLIAVLLSAQCTDEKVNKVTPSLFAKANTPEKILAIEIKEIEKIIYPCGLYHKKALAIQKLSRILAKKYQGKVPKNLKELKSLPGIGHKSASVILSLGFGIPGFPVDTHIFRCAKRWGLSRGKNVRSVEKALKRLFAKKSWNQLHLQILLFGRHFCTAKKHSATTCPMCSKLSKEKGKKTIKAK